MRVRFLAASVLVALGCAEGSAIDTGQAAAAGVGGEGGAITGAGGYGNETSSHTSSTTSGSSGGSDTGGSGTGGIGGTGGEGGGVGGEGMGGMGGAGGSGGGPVCDFSSPNTCQTAQALVSVAGDDGGVVTAQGNTSKWFVVKIAEDNSNIFEVDMSYTVSLTSPPGMVYDLVVHQGPQDGGPDCNAPAKMGQGNNPKTVSDSWDDDQGIGGEDDSVYLSIGVLYVSGDDCNTNWTLVVEGGT